MSSGQEGNNKELQSLNILAIETACNKMITQNMVIIYSGGCYLQVETNYLEIMAANSVKCTQLNLSYSYPLTLTQTHSSTNNTPHYSSHKLNFTEATQVCSKAP